MKLQNLSVIFVVIIIPILLVLAYYLSLQSDTINMQTSYNTKLLESTKEAIDAFEINTVELNDEYSDVDNSKRRNLMASINTFTTSLANNIGVSGTSKEYILSHVPAIAFTLYDGYYIYSPAETRITIEDKNGSTVFCTKKLVEQNRAASPQVWPQINLTGASFTSENENKILYKPKDGTVHIDGYYISENGATPIPFTLNENDAQTEYKHILKPFNSYSEKVKTSENDSIVVNYTLDNYITIYGYIDDGSGTEAYVSRAGYLTDPNKITGLKHNSVKGIMFNDRAIEKEELSEQIAWYEYNGAEVISVNVEEFNYVYEAEGNTKIYFEEDGEKAFILDNVKNTKVYLTDSLVRYKKCTIPLSQGGTTDINTYKEVYQNLYNGKWYSKDEEGLYFILEENSIWEGITDEKTYDYSAINYCVESYVFTRWFNNLELKVAVDNAGTPDDITDDIWDDSVLQISSSNNPDPESKDEKISSFSEHKRQVIKETVESNLNQAITNYSRKAEGEYKLPVLTETDWDQILSNVSIITFLQDIPIGLKEYNNYAIATSTVNNEYVDSEGIYLNANDRDSNYYHMPYCEQLGTENLIGYRNIDYIQKSYKDIYNKTKYYFKHDNSTNINIEQSCYSCIVQKSLYKEESSTEDFNKKAKAYYTALARERYIAEFAKLPSEVEAAVTLIAHHVTEDGITSIGTGTIEKINLESGETETSIKNSIRIREEDANHKYIIKPIQSDKALNEEHNPEIAQNLGNFNTNYGIKEYVDDYSVYKSNEQASIIVNEYANSLVRFTVDELKENATAYTNYTLNPTEKEIMEQGDSGELDLSNGDATINVVLKYEKNYVVEGGTSVDAYAVINDYNDLTIVSKIEGITGYVRLKFTNGSNVYYSENIFNIKETIPADQRIVYCRISGDSEVATSWYNNEWAVEVVAVDKITPLVGSSDNYIKYYTLRDSSGLKGFANAVNGIEGPNTGAKTINRKFYVVDDIDMKNVVDNMYPIAQDYRKNWFNGEFSGKYNVSGIDLVDAGDNHSITNLTIKVNNSQGNHYAFGLFGWVGKDGGTIENLTIDTIEVQYTGSNNDIKLGGLAGYCDTGTGISGITINKGTINGGTYTGGIAGKSDRIISDCTVSNISSLTAKQYAGGIVGYAENAVSVCNVSSVTTLSGGADTGGIAGHTKNTISNCTVSTITTLSGTGSIGGIVGYAENAVSVCNVSSVTTLTGEGNVGGIVGNTLSTVSSCNISGVTTLKGTGSVGGIAGFIQNSISNCNANITTIRNADFSKNEHYQLYIGGIAGYTTGTIQGSSITATNIGTGDVTMKKSSNQVSILGINVGGTNKYCVGGIAGYTSANITGTTLNSTVQIKGGKISVGSSTDSNAFICAGGRVGYKASSQQADSSWGIDCYVSGYDNVGGIIGYNANGNITGITRGSNVYGSGENVGGIVGLNQGGAISNCTNNATVTGVSGNLAENVGGIVGLNNGKNITKCYNKKTVTGDKNVGGIAGVSYGGNIEDCGNNNTITGRDNTNYLGFYFTGNENCTGTGGITGKVYGTDILRSYNTANIICNYNGGGITGLNHGSRIYYSYNDGSITSSSRNRIGGICGAGNSVDIGACYNIGSITGVEDMDVLSNGIGGIIGTCVDNAYFLHLYSTQPFPNNKYLGEIKVQTLAVGQTSNTIKNCYNAGSISGGYTSTDWGIWDLINWFKDNFSVTLGETEVTQDQIADPLNHMCGIAGSILWAPNGNNILLQNNYYLDNVKNGARSSWSNVINGGVTKLGDSGMKEQLYKWAALSSGSGGLIVPDGETGAGKYIYNTTAPMEITLGYQGYGILWWQIPGYVRLETYICSGYQLDGQNYYMPIEKFCNPILAIKKGNDEIEQILDDNANKKLYNSNDNSTNYHCWIMMVKKDNNGYQLKGKATNYPESAYIDYTAQENSKVLIVLGATVNEVRLYPAGTATINWSSFSTTVERDTVFKYNHTKDFTFAKESSREITAVYSGKIKDSEVIKKFTKDNLMSDDNNYGYVYLDGAGVGFNVGTLSIFPNATATLNNYQITKYYKTKSDANVFNWDYTYWKTDTESGDTEKIVGKAGTTIQIPIEDIEEKTKNGVLPFVEGQSQVLTATAHIKCYAFIEGTTLEKILDFLDFLDISQFKDELKVWVEIDGVTAYEDTNVQYGWNNTEDDKLTLDISDIDILDINSGEIPETVNIKLEWGAKLVGMNFAIDSTYIDVRYTAPSASSISN